MIPERSFFKFVNTMGTTPTSIDYDKIKQMWQDVGAENIADTEDTYGGITFDLLGIPVHLYRADSSNPYKNYIKFGSSDAYNIGNNSSAFVDFSAATVYKGSTNTVILVHQYNGGYSLSICLDTIRNIIYVLGYRSSNTFKLCGIKYEDETNSIVEYSIGIDSGDVQISTKNLTDEAILEKISFFDELMESAPQKYKPSLYTNVPSNGEIVKLDDKYYFSMIGLMYKPTSSSGTPWFTYHGFGSIVFPLGE